MVIPTTSISWSAVLTASRRCGRIIASTFFIKFSLSLYVGFPSRCSGDRNLAGKHSGERDLDGLHPGVREFHSLAVGDVKNVQRVTFFRRYPGTDNIQLQRRKGGRDLVYQPGFIGGVHLDQGG